MDFWHNQWLNLAKIFVLQSYKNPFESFDLYMNNIFTFCK